MCNETNAPFEHIGTAFRDPVPSAPTNMSLAEELHAKNQHLKQTIDRLQEENNRLSREMQILRQEKQLAEMFALQMGKHTNRF